MASFGSGHRRHRHPAAAAAADVAATAGHREAEGACHRRRRSCRPEQRPPTPRPTERRSHRPPAAIRVAPASVTRRRPRPSPGRSSARRGGTPRPARTLAWRRRGARPAVVAWRRRDGRREPRRVDVGARAHAVVLRRQHIVSARPAAQPVKKYHVRIAPHRKPCQQFTYGYVCS